MKLPRSTSTVPRRPAQRPLATRVPAKAVLASLGLALAAAALPAHATLGEGLASVESDRLHLQASVQRHQLVAYSLHIINLGRHGVVREYAGRDGTVFAVTWHTTTMPNLRLLLGKRYDELQQPTVRQRRDLNHVEARTEQVAYLSSGHLRSFHGGAYLIQGLPSGVTVDDIK